MCNALQIVKGCRVASIRAMQVKEERRVSSSEQQVDPLQSLDLEHIRYILKKSKDAAEANSAAQISPLQPGDIKCIDDVSDGEEMRWIRAGFKLIAQVLCSGIPSSMAAK